MYAQGYGVVHQLDSIQIKQRVDGDLSWNIRRYNWYSTYRLAPTLIIYITYLLSAGGIPARNFRRLEGEYLHAPALNIIITY